MCVPAVHWCVRCDVPGNIHPMHGMLSTPPHRPAPDSTSGARSALPHAALHAVPGDGPYVLPPFLLVLLLLVGFVKRLLHCALHCVPHHKVHGRDVVLQHLLHGTHDGSAQRGRQSELLVQRHLHAWWVVLLLVRVRLLVVRLLLLLLLLLLRARQLRVLPV
jgi:hypothetical protein